LNGNTTIPNFTKIYQAVQKDTQTDRQTGDLISLLSFLESRLKIANAFYWKYKYHKETKNKFLFQPVRAQW
jgi:hypothetical protein